MILSDTQTWALGAAMAMIALDVVTGFISAALRHDIQSVKMREGLWHKASELIIIFIGFGLELVQEHVDMGLDIPTGIALCGYIVLMEFASIIENIRESNPDLQESRLWQALSKRKDNDEENA